MARADLAPVIPLRALVSGEDELSRLRRAVDLPRLIEVGYDAHAHIIRPHAEHPVFGYELCPVVHCTAAVERHALCEACWRRFQGFQGTLEEFALLPRARVHGPAQQPLCLVCRTAGHERPAWRCKGLCRSCDAQRKYRGQTVAEYVPGAEPRPSFGRCGRCGHLAAFATPRLCEPCHRRWVAAGKPDLSEFARTRLRGDREPSRELDLSPSSTDAFLDTNLGGTDDEPVEDIASEARAGLPPARDGRTDNRDARARGWRGRRRGVAGQARG